MGTAAPGCPAERSSAVMNVQPESRVHTRFVGQRWKRMLSLSALARSRTLRARFSEAASLTIRFDALVSSPDGG